MIPLKNNPDCYIVNVPGDAHTFASEKDRLFYKNTFGGIENIGHSRYIGFEFKILGEITDDHIGFDVEPFVKRIAVGIFQNYNHESPNMNHHCKNANDSFYSLLEASGVYFKNTYGESEPPQKTYDALGRDLNIEWHNAQKDVLQKGVIIKKI